MAIDWMQEIKDRVRVPGVARAIGLQESRGGWSCPACGEVQRGSHDKRGAVGVRHDGLGWECHRCKESGSVIDMLALSLIGKKHPAKREDWARVREFAAGQGWCTSHENSTPKTGALPAYLSPPIPQTPEKPIYPPADQVLALWDATRKVVSDTQAEMWIESRGLDPDQVADFDLVRVIPESLELPSWAVYGGRSWIDAGYRALFPFYDAAGDLVTVQARNITGPPTKRKAVSPKGYEIRGAVMACHLGRQILQEGLPSWWVSGVPLRVIITEGGTDFLTIVTHINEEDNLAPIVLGVIAGSWPDNELGDQLAERFPTESQWLIHTDPDPAGDGYAEKIAKTLSRHGVTQIKRGR